MEVVLGYIQETFYSYTILLATFLLGTIFLKRKDHFLIKALIVIVLLIVFGGSYYLLFNFCLISWPINYIKLFNTFWYPILLIIFYFAFLFSFKCGRKEGLAPFTMGFLIETTAFGLFRLFIDFGLVELRELSIFSVIFEFLIETIYILLVSWVVYIENKKGNIKFYKYNKSFVFIIILALIMFLRLNLQAVYEDVYKMGTGWFINLSICLIPVVFLVLIFSILTNEELSKEKAILNNVLIEKEKQYELSKENIDIINRKCHDIKYQLKSLNLVDSNDKKEIIEELSNTISIYDTTIETGNIALNAVLIEKSLYCVSHRIKFSKIIDGKKLDFMNQVDIYTLFGNIIDNAIEAVDKIENQDKRVISLVSNINANYLTIRVDNYFVGQLNIENNTIKTSKKDKTRHGFGTQSIKFITEKYNGNVLMKVEDDIFILVLSFPINN